MVVQFIYGNSIILYFNVIFNTFSSITFNCGVLWWEVCKNFPTWSGSKSHNLQPTNITFYKLCASDVNLMFIVLTGEYVLEVK